MYILLVNSNAIISKLFHSVEKELDSLDEVPHLDILLSKKAYDVIFIDEVLCSEHLLERLKGFNESKKVTISYRSDIIEGFDATLEKPFLPSQIIHSIQGLNIQERSRESVLDRNEIDKIKSLLSLDAMIDTSENTKKQKDKKTKTLLIPKIKKKN
jgi:uncharacterized membrane protein